MYFILHIRKQTSIVGPSICHTVLRNSEWRYTSQNPKRFPRIQNWSQNLDSGTCFWILGRVLDSGKCFGFWEVFWVLGSVFGFWDVFWILGSVFGCWEVFWILRGVFGFWEVLWNLESVLSARATVFNYFDYSSFHEISSLQSYILNSSSLRRYSSLSTT